MVHNNKKLKSFIINIVVIHASICKTQINHVYVLFLDQSVKKLLESKDVKHVSVEDVQQKTN